MCSGVGGTDTTQQPQSVICPFCLSSAHLLSSAIHIGKEDNDEAKTHCDEQLHFKMCTVDADVDDDETRIKPDSRLAEWATHLQETKL